jgi:gamma-glutamyltranspeptidase
MSHPNGPITGRPPAHSSRGMVATSHTLATEAGVRALRRGGSAVDAAIAANAVLCVAYPHMAGLGGDGFWLIGRRGSPDVAALNASGPAAARATIDHYRDRGFDEIPARGVLGANTVPGAVDGWRLAHERHGRLDWNELFGDAVHLASTGVPVSRSLADWIHDDVDVLLEHGLGSIYLRDGRPLREGDRLVQGRLGESLRTIAERGPRDGFYDGPLAERLVAVDESILTADDFARYRAEWVEPIRGMYRGHEIVEMPPNTQGFTVLQIMGMLEHFDVVEWGDGTYEYFHHMAELVKIAFADRDAWWTDPTFVDIPLDRLLDPSYLDERRRLIDPDRAAEVDEFPPGIEFEGTRSGARDAGGDTCAFCAVDEDGLIVSVIQSIFHDFGSAIEGGDTGIILQNRGSFFSLDEHHANVLEPGKRSAHTLIPAMLLRDGEPVMAFGSMGGEGQPQTQAAILTRLIDFGYDVQQAIEAPRWLMGRTWGTKSRDLSLEARIPPEVVRELVLRGQPVKMVSLWNDNMGHAQAIRMDPRLDFLEGGADPRGDGAAWGY